MEKWYYYKRADITIGEKKVKQYALYILLLLLSLLVSGSVAGYKFRTEIYDYVVNPSAILTEKEVTVEVGSDFDVSKYYLVNNDRVKVELPEKPDTSKLGEYELDYKSKNSVRENVVKLKVKVVDTTAPVITLTQDSLVLTRDVDTQSFDAKNYISSVTDNYDKTEDIKVDYPTSLDFSKDSVECKYIATDKSGNESTKTLVIAVKDKPVEPPVVEQPTYTQPNYTQPSYTEPSYSQPSYQASSDIVGVHDISVPIGTSFATLSGMLTSGVSSGYAVSVNFASVNLTVAGTYPVTFTNTAGVSATAYVTVY